MGWLARLVLRAVSLDLAERARAGCSCAARMLRRSANASVAEPKGSNITYRMTPSGLVIEVDGLRLEPKAEPLKFSGGWGVHLSVHVSATDAHAHHLLSPANGPLMVATEIDGTGGKKERIGDERKGDAEMIIEAGEATSFDRAMTHPIKAGESLKLQVGLWGVGRDAEDRRPIKKLFVVNMIAGAKTPQPVITPPE